MAEPNFADELATLNGTLGAIEVRLALGRAPVEGLEGFKSALDDMRLRLWGLLSAASANEAHGFQEQFRLKRATAMCRRLGADLRAGTMGGQYPELGELRDAVMELTQSITQAQQNAF